jgi:hypothetical protein
LQEFQEDLVAAKVNWIFVGDGDDEGELNTSESVLPIATAFAPVAATFWEVELTEILLSPVIFVPFICKAAVTVPPDV